MSTADLRIEDRESSPDRKPGSTVMAYVRTQMGEIGSKAYKLLGLPQQPAKPELSSYDKVNLILEGGNYQARVFGTTDGVGQYESNDVNYAKAFSDWRLLRATSFDQKRVAELRENNLTLDEDPEFLDRVRIAELNALTQIQNAALASNPNQAARIGVLATDARQFVTMAFDTARTGGSGAKEIWAKRNAWLQMRDLGKAIG
jgi:hypothetical protein